MTRLFFCLAITCGCLFGQHSFTVIDVEDGGRLYRANCTICHGAEGNGVPGIDLLVTASVDLSGAPAAFDTLRRPGEHGKIVVRPQR